MSARAARPRASIAVLMTCHNRRNLTLRCLESLVAQPEFDPAGLFLVDDGSTDGTGDAVRQALPQANVLDGDGSLWWNGGMQRAWDAAKANENAFDYYLWLNDDVVLSRGTLAMLLVEADRHDTAIVSAATCDPDTGATTYGGSVRTDPGRPLRLKLVDPAGSAVPVDTISGNIVLVSAGAERTIGGLDPQFTHIYGDLDYGFRAREAGIPVLLAADYGGTCAANDPAGSSLDPSASKVERLRRSIKELSELHARDWRRFVAKYTASPIRRAAHAIAPVARILAGRPHPGSGAGR